MAKTRKPALQVEGTTKVVGIFGDPVEHSLSPRMHNAAFAELQLDYVYVPMRPRKGEIGKAVRSIRTLGLTGVNVTVPFKESVRRYLDELRSDADDVGAVNTIWRDGDKLIGDNTDVVGFKEALRSHGVRLRGKRALLIGAGGAARAVVHALMTSRVSEVVLVNRTVSKARRLARSFDRRGEIVTPAGLETLDDRTLLTSCDLVINSTSVGLNAKDRLDYDVSATHTACVHFDLAYGEKPTAFLAAAQQAGRPTIDGRHMLLHQGAAAFKHFTGRRAPLEVMATAIGIRA